ncbi:hypothetical protein FEM48_Zijuj08G0111300 [Ziziphus jujuba var. spinosa]|uniref:RPW8 domain-containing protein n=1 Tax=Ziziphus jujuba var. spinosa TaxID=714518 RepID=A0A978UYR2_ZIZJJ|nr:hypothetical protein FEM48_Zijuj08G0111300 [Ziziphus jujuba var. spinosa]
MVLDFGGAALGAAFGALFDVVIEIKNKNLMFKPILKKLKSTLESLKPLITVIEKYNKKLDLPEGETTDFKLEMKKGEELVRKCSKVNKFNIFIKSYLAGKLTELDDTLRRLIEILEAQGVRDGKENLTLTREIRLDLKENLRLTREIHSKVDGGGSNNGLVHNQINVPAISSCDVLDQLPSLTVGLEKPLKELKMRLLNNGAPLLVVNGRGGVGKTLLARRFCLDDEVKEKFKSNIFFVVVSKTQPTVSSIVQRLHKHTGNEVPDLPDEAVAVRYLKQLLNKLSPSPILLVLDDVWPGSVSLVQNFVVQIPEYKILVTSRSQLPGFGPPDFAPPYHLEPLNDGDAMTLFRFWACLEDWSSHIPYDIVKKIVDHYNVSPLALKIVAGSLSGQPTEIWRRRLKECSNGSPTLSSETELDTHLQSYLDDLKISEKECFMDLGSFPEDQRISVVSLIDMWTEFYELEEDGDAVINLIDLDLRNLANLVVTSHLTFTLFPYISTPYMIFLSDETFSSKWFDMQLPEAKILVLNFRTKDYALPKFLENMSQLKVLIVTNYSSFHAEVGNFQLLGSLNNMKRIRLERISIPTPSKTPVKLENLQKISLFMCSIGDAFSNCSIKLSEFLPNLKEMNIDFCDDLVKLPVQFCDSNCMKKLSITYCPKLSELPDGIGDMVNLEVLRLRSCIRLQGLPGSIGNLSNLTFLDICDCVSIENLPDRVGELHNLRKLNMTNCSKLQDLPESLKELEQLKVLICDDNGKQLWESSLPHRNDVDIRLTIKDINLNWMPGFGQL